MATKQKQEKISLTEPVEFAGKTYEQLIAREPKVKQLRSIKTEDDGDTMLGFQIALAAACCGVDEGVVEELSFADWRRVAEAIEKVVPMEHATSVAS